MHNNAMQTTNHSLLFASISNYSIDYFEINSFPLPTEVILTTLFLFVFIFAFFGNLLVLFLFVKYKSLRTLTNFFLGNLAVADFMISIFCIIPQLLRLVFYIHPYWIFCKLMYYVQAFCYTASIKILILISVERYVAIVHPIKSRELITFKRLKLASASIWLFSAIYNLPYLIFPISTRITVSLTQSTILCYIPSWDIVVLNQDLYQIINVVVFYFLPLIVMVILYARIIICIVRRYKEIDKARESRKDSGINKTSTDRLLIRKPLLNVDTGTSFIRRPSTLSVYSLMNSTISNNESLIQRHLNNGSITTDYGADETCLKYKYCLNSCFKSSTKCKYNTRQVDVFDEHTHSFKKTNINTNDQSINVIILKSRHKVIRLLIVLLSCFAFNVLPYQCQLIISKFGLFEEYQNTDEFRLFVIISLLFYYSNAGVNCFIYFLLSNRFRNYIYKVFGCKYNKKQKRFNRHGRQNSGGFTKQPKPTINTSVV